MDYFPQLETGAMGQYPLRRSRRTRTVENRLPGGTTVRYADAAAEMVEWQLEYRDLTDSEAEALVNFFKAVEGRLRPFTFLDPAGNLLAWSEKLDEGAWGKNPLTAVTAGVADPFGGTRAWQIAGPAPAGLTQTLSIPERFRYCFSVFARADSGATVSLLGGAQRSEHRLTPLWKRLAHTCGGAGAGETVRFGIELAEGGCADFFGFQAEPQTGASGYKRTTSRTGVHTNARLGDDRLELTATGPGRQMCTVSVIHGEHF